MSDSSVAGMTVNERLYHFGLVDRFDIAARSSDVQAMVQVLLEAQYSEAQALQTAQAVAADLRRYGY